MPSLIDIRRRIRSVKNTQQITRAMKLVSAAKLRRAQDRVLAARPYSAELAKLLADVARSAKTDERLVHPLLAERPAARIQLILITADRGLAGAFNSNLIKAAQQFLAEHAAQARRDGSRGAEGPGLLPQAPRRHQRRARGHDREGRPMPTRRTSRRTSSRASPPAKSTRSTCSTTNSRAS